MARSFTPLAKPPDSFVQLRGLRADFLLRIAANDNNGRHAAYSQAPLRYLHVLLYRIISHKSARKHLIQDTAV